MTRALEEKGTLLDFVLVNPTKGETTWIIVLVNQQKVDYLDCVLVNPTNWLLLDFGLVNPIKYNL